MNIQILQILHKKELFAIIVKKNNQFKKSGVNFVTKDTNPLQLGFLKHKKGHTIKSHLHIKKVRKVKFLSECLMIKKGKIKVSFYDDKKRNIKKDQILKKDDLIMLFRGGHGFKVIQDVEIIEVKQGPYTKSKDKILI